MVQTCGQEAYYEPVMINVGRLAVLGEQYADHVVDHFPDHTSH
jgi:hypothetical protein